MSVLSFGAWQLGDPQYWGSDGEAGADADATVSAAIDEGVNLFDTAESYGGGESERALGRALGKRRDDVFVATKVSPENCTPEALRRSCEGSLERLGTDRIDLYQVHWPCREVPFEDVCGELAQLRDEGKIRHAAVSNFGPQDLSVWLDAGEAVSNQIGYNMLFRAAEYRVIPACRRNGVGVLVYMPLMQGLLTGRWDSIKDIPMLRRRTRHFAKDREGVRHGEAGFEALLMDTLTDLKRFADRLGLPMASLALAWLTAQPGVTSVLVGGRNASQMQRNLAAADVELGPAMTAKFNEISAPLKGRMGGNPDMWQSGDDARIR